MQFSLIYHRDCLAIFTQIDTLNNEMKKTWLLGLWNFNSSTGIKYMIYHESLKSIFVLREKVFSEAVTTSAAT